jgi:ribosome-associated protein
VTGRHVSRATRADATTDVGRSRATRRVSTIDSAVAAQRAAAVCVDNKAYDVVLLNLKPLTDMADYFVIASGTSDTHVRSVAERVTTDLKKEGITVYHVEGLAQGRWVLLDYVDFVVHVFHPTLRSFYQLERLWGDAEVTSMDAAAAG